MRHCDTAVSYTHLDVYKRQGFLAAYAGRTYFLIGVGYTHGIFPFRVPVCHQGLHICYVRSPGAVKTAAAKPPERD